MPEPRSGTDAPRAPRAGAQPTAGDPTSTKRPVRARGKATRARLVAAGVTVFSRRGFHATRVDDIVRRARTSHGTFYLYFSSKDDLFDQIVAEAVDEFHQLTETLPTVRDDPDGRAALEGWLASFVDLYGSYGPLIRTWTDAAAPDGSGVPDLLRTIAAELTEKVRARPGTTFDPAIASLVVVAMVERLNYFLTTDQLPGETDRLVGVMAAIVLDAFFGPGH